MGAEAKVLFVDDDAQLVKSFKRRFKGEFNIEVALSGQEGLEVLASQGPFGVVVSDYRMPVMDGIEFLSQVSKIAPDTVRIILTGHADLNTAIKAVNEGHVFRFLTKPHPPEDLAQAVREGLRYYQLIAGERELKALKKWREIIEAMVAAFVTLVETRDPYTAGHQQKVARLSSKIAEEMGLPKDQAEAIRLAATIHDIGKMYVPAEFLNRPGKLTEIELSIIRLHPRVGYDILRPIAFEHPIPEIVWQHHERLDGSGYPQGLAGENILLEARIIAVADVVEAISAHRPYRPSLGLERAFEEIEKNGNVLYDPQACQACLRLFREKRFSFGL